MYFLLNDDCCGMDDFSSIHKCIVVMKMLAYGTPANSDDDYFHMSESTSIECTHRFCRAVVGKFVADYLRGSWHDTQ
jgi:hypothetical protein